MTCKGTCTAVPALKGVPYVSGRLPRDPFTGRSVEPGTYGPWTRCRTCDVVFIWQGIFCPCCGGRTSSRPRACRRLRTIRIAEDKAMRIRIAAELAAVAAAPAPVPAVAAQSVAAGSAAGAA